MVENKKTWSERFNAKLEEPEGEIFERGKWRWWFWMVIPLQAMSAILTALIFAGSEWMIGFAAGFAALLAWCVVGTIHYSGTKDARMAKGVSLLDSIALCFAMAHFSACLYVYGHLLTLRAAEVKYEQAVATTNDRLKNLSSDNVKIAESAAQVAKFNKESERLRNDTAYQARRAYEAGARIPSTRASASGGVSPSLQTSPIEIVKPKPPEHSSVAFLDEWDALIRLANFGELILAAITFIYIRNRSARANAQNAPQLSGNGPRNDFSPSAASLRPVATVAGLDAKKAAGVATVAEVDSAVNILRNHLREIAFYIPGHWFRADPIDGGVSIRLYTRNKQGREVRVKSTRQSNKILSAVNQPDFRERLTRELIACGFPIGKGE